MSEVRILIAEDEILVARDLELQLTALGYQVVGIAAQGAEVLTLVAEQKPDLLVLDIHLQGEMDGISVAENLRQKLFLPVVYLTAHADDATLRRAKTTEPYGYILKPFEERELRTVIEMALYKHQSEKKLRQSERRYATTLKSIGDAVIATNEQARVTFMNPEAERLTGWTLPQAAGRPLAEIFPIVNEETRQPAFNPVTRVLAEGIIVGLANSTVLISRDGREFPIDDCASPIQEDLASGESRVTGAVLVFRDITAKRRAEEEKRVLEARVLQAQKLESLGILAGGIAHDFNNLLTAILGHADLAFQQLPLGSPLCEHLDQIMAGTRRAADLTTQMLAYAGKTRIVSEPQNLSELVRSMIELLRVSLPKKAQLQCHLAPDLPPIQGDAAQLRQVIMNLILNAGDALGDREGAITLRTTLRYWEDQGSPGTFWSRDLPPCNYVLLEVIDTGCGMSPETLSRIFDPFFTTKFTGRGLGLAAVLGIVHSHQGSICVSSTPGRGSTFQVYFPVIPGQSVATSADAATTGWHGRGTILVVDDEEVIRQVAQRMLQSFGFTVLLAKDGREALAVYRQHAEQIAGVLLDLTMPVMNGAEAFREMRRIRGDVRVVFSSGYGEQEARQQLPEAALVWFVAKPYRIAELERVMRDAGF